MPLGYYHRFRSKALRRPILDNFTSLGNNVKPTVDENGNLYEATQIGGPTNQIVGNGAGAVHSIGGVASIVIQTMQVPGNPSAWVMKLTYGDTGTATTTGYYAGLTGGGKDSVGRGYYMHLWTSGFRILSPIDGVVYTDVSGFPLDGSKIRIEKTGPSDGVTANYKFYRTTVGDVDTLLATAVGTVALDGNYVGLAANGQTAGTNYTIPTITKWEQLS